MSAVNTRQSLALFISAAAALFSLFAALSFGAAETSLQDVFNSFLLSNDASFNSRIIFELRMPRTLLAFLAGSGLAIAGLILQTVTRNPLADPYLFGISSGASFGVVLLMALAGISAGFMLSAAALLGSLLAMSLLILIAGRQQSAQVESMLLAGVALSFLFSAFTSLLLYWSDPQAVAAILFWTLGSFSRAQWATLWLPLLVITLCTFVMLSFRRQLNAMLLGDESAITLGVRVQRFRILMLVLSSLITAVLVAMCGGIGFVGLMVPHIVRFFISQGTIAGLLVTSLVGGTFMVWVDVLSRSLLKNQELPVGVITAAIGSVFFLSLLFFRKRRV
ncbi:iron ABC transporter permease [Pseudoalteromonas sp. Hal273]|jgi:iron complex transport system permease protein|uniref:FecCD family ABC transporter permease n=1 Tax=Pseudoalteromonas TaxID=53246 RepID=UPI0013FD15AC|nr:MULTISPECIES: iron ABC transporter permease [Pseudoalteromonas]MBB1296557.1 iron ABC transporter permease [Pseudoalteromonas sp. SR41-7]MBB1349058.1 iron ABC transporter permease [Pseudoalteromonas sp. SG45-3]MBB1359436.1 iron ABC transporter permease [Pseudoalteromonas sp. SG45-6]MBB1443751.1 iron ABC transporter permease [Pseudoalteromonas sp. SG43-3]MBB1451252.1 iron ABC transporter permease [Pseudoalteromonas sp. SG43-1]